VKDKIDMDEQSLALKVIINTLFFIFGFTIVFVLLGLGAGSVAGFLNRYKSLIALIGGIIIIIFSIQVMGILNIPFLNYEKKTSLRRRPKGILGAFIIGITFAAAWTPCIGPILSSILIFAATKDNVFKAAALLVSYSLGLGIPFLFSAVAFSYFISFSRFVKNHFKIIKILSGVLLLALGLVLVLGQFHRFSAVFGFIPDITTVSSEKISILIALAAGFISFISPCVLPLIPSYLTFITGVSVLEHQKEI
jgi:cytochrome c-type biogenesis protein